MAVFLLSSFSSDMGAAMIVQQVASCCTYLFSSGIHTLDHEGYFGGKNIAVTLFLESSEFYGGGSFFESFTYANPSQITRARYLFPDFI